MSSRRRGRSDRAESYLISSLLLGKIYCAVFEDDHSNGFHFVYYDSEEVVADLALNSSRDLETLIAFLPYLNERRDTICDTSMQRVEFCSRRAVQRFQEGLKAAVFGTFSEPTLRGALSPLIFSATSERLPFTETGVRLVIECTGCSGDSFHTDVENIACAMKLAIEDSFEGEKGRDSEGSHLDVVCVRRSSQTSRHSIKPAALVIRQQHLRTFRNFVVRLRKERERLKMKGEQTSSSSLQILLNALSFPNERLRRLENEKKEFQLRKKAIFYQHNIGGERQDEYLSGKNMDKASILFDNNKEYKTNQKGSTMKSSFRTADMDCGNEEAKGERMLL
eukprot:g1392.t1